MTSPLDRRVAKLEAASRAADGDDTAVRVVFVHPGEDADEKIAALGPLPRKNGRIDPLIVVNFVRPADVQSPATLQ